MVDQDSRAWLGAKQGTNITGEASGAIHSCLHILAGLNNDQYDL